ncbi:permease [Methylomonas sp. LL1]|uniref:permease n=1 Tax=Methylomonas sp. LL1 TaxID=2785785 RepID=UPI0018C42559|nr:permease [Methylomonas sp. LL1]QPK63214.1 permease [Methylomonas sp. LL1]
MNNTSFWRDEWKALLLIVAGFLVCFYLPVEALQSWERLHNAFWEALYLVRWYAEEHVLLCLIPAFFIAGAIAVFVSQGAVMKYLGATAPKGVAYAVASVSGTILAVCSCTVLPLFAGIYRMGAGLGPAIAFLYSGPAINVLAIILTARILGMELGIARALGAVLFSVVIGLIMAYLFRKEELEKIKKQVALPEEEPSRPLWQNSLFLATLVLILVFANWAKSDNTEGLWHAIYAAKWWLTGLFGVTLAIILSRWFQLPSGRLTLVAVVTAAAALLFGSQPLLPFAAAVIGLSWITSTDQDQGGAWFGAAWDYAKQILPLLLIGVLIAGALLGRPGHEGLIPSEWVSVAVGGNSIGANFFAAFAGAFMYFATLTEVPIVQGLVGSGMGEGPALALLLAGPALSLPNMLVIRSILGTTKTVAFVSLVIVMATGCGLLYGLVMHLSE